MISIVPFSKEDFDRLMVWVMDKDDLIQFAGPIFQHPLTKAQLERYIEDDRRKAFKVVFESTKEVIGHCELNYERPIPRLSRILIGDQSFRGIGLGFKLLDIMLNKIFTDTKANSADLNVFEWNVAAIKAYEKIGFVQAEGQVDDTCNNINGWNAINMVITKERWLTKSRIGS